MRKLIIIVAVTLCLCVCVSASALPGEAEIRKALPEQADTLLDGTSAEGGFAHGLAKILGKIPLHETVRGALRSVGMMLCALVLCAMADGGEGLSPAVIAGSIAIMASGMLELHSLSASGQQALSEMQSFADILLPAMTAATAASGGITASSAIYAGTALFTDVLMRIMTGVMIPALYAYMALRAAQTVCGNDVLDRLCGLIRWAFQSGLKTILFLFTAYLTITGLVSGAADATAIKAAKLTLSGMVPVVGSLISDASETVIVGAQTVRNSVGVFGMLAVIAICIGPFVRIGMQYLLLKLAGAAGGALGPKPLLRLMDSVTESVGFLLAMTGVSALMLLVACICYLKVSPG